MPITHTTEQELGAGLEQVRAAPSDTGVVRLIVRRPGVDRREIVDEAQLHVDLGLVGDDWVNRASQASLDGSPARHAQVTLMNARYAALIAGPASEGARRGISSTRISTSRWRTCPPARCCPSDRPCCA